MKAEYKTKSGHMMKAMNLWSMLFLGIALSKSLIHAPCNTMLRLGFTFRHVNLVLLNIFFCEICIWCRYLRLNISPKYWYR